MEIAAINGAKFRLEPGETTAQHVERYAPMFFDPDFEPMVTCKSPGDGQDILASSANNFYDGVTMADLEGFEEKNQLNSRLAKRDGALVEEVYKVGGVYDRELTQYRRAPARRRAVRAAAVCAGAAGAGQVVRDRAR